ncbi:MAG: GPR endopeptidase [Oscillospiraceae bacterium]|jgi:spore protease|nr:GPR endopeptidase [Oscillospiraceae bacterium]
MFRKRTDLACEAVELWGEGAERAGELSGVISSERKREGFPVATVEIINERGADALGKPMGKYVTIEIDGLINREDKAFSRAAEALAAELGEMLRLRDGESVLVAGLGNRAITPDAIGPETVKNTMVTSHLIEHMPEAFPGIRRVFAIEPGVLGTTGIESARLIKAVAGIARPDRVIVVDALAARRTARICRTVQLADTGIIPGSGVGNAREGINRETLGAPVIAIGVPTVVDAGTLAADIASRAGATWDDNPEALERLGAGLVVTPKDIDAYVGDISKLIGYAINMALHRSLTTEDITMFLG